MDVNEFSDLQQSFLSIKRVDSNELGKLYINDEKSVYFGNFEYEDILKSILTGKKIEFSRFSERNKKIFDLRNSLDNPISD